MTMPIKVSQAKSLIETTLKSNLVPFLVGSPGVGKSAIIKDIANKYSLKVIDIRLSQCDPVDLNGFPNLEGKKATYRPMDIFPLDTDSIPDGYAGWLLFLDEFNSAPMSVQAAAYKLVLDRQVGMHNLHPKVAIVCAGNLETDNAIVNTLSTALQSRLIHFELKVDHEEWLDWANANGINHMVSSYINFKPDSLHKFKPDSPDSTFPCPRTWEFASKLLDHSSLDNELILQLLTGALGEGMAREFYGFSRIYKDLPSIQEIINNPEKTPIPAELSTMYAIAGSIASHADEDNLEALLKYVARLDDEFVIITVRQMVQRTPELKQHKAFLNLVKTKGVALIRLKDMY